eukprot:4112590-Pyramimonas_sp.AAC.1
MNAFTVTETCSGFLDSGSAVDTTCSGTVQSRFGRSSVAVAVHSQSTRSPLAVHSQSTRSPN